MIASRPKKPPRIGDRHVVRPDMDAVGTGGERNIDAVVDDESRTERRQRLFDRPRLFHHGAGVAVLVAQLNERRAALRAEPRQFGKIAAIGALGIDNRV